MGTNLRLLQVGSITVEIAYAPDAPALQDVLEQYISNISPLPAACETGTIEA